MTVERPTFSFAALTQSGAPWSCYVVDGRGRIAVDEAGSLSTSRPPASTPAWLLGRTADGTVHCTVTAAMLADAPATGTAAPSPIDEPDAESPKEDRLPVTTLGELDAGSSAPNSSAPGSKTTPHFIRLTEVAATLSDDEALLATQAVSLGRWHADNRYCSRCAAPMRVSEAGWAAVCSRCGATEYPRTDPAVIVRVTDAQDRILLGHNTAWPEKRMSLLAGYVDAGETPRRAVERELREEVDLEVTGSQYVGAQPWPGPRSLMLGFDARVEDTPEPHPDSLEIDRAQFFSRAQLRAAIATGELIPPGPASIAHALIADWLGEPLTDSDQIGKLLDRLATQKFRASFTLSFEDRQLVEVRGMSTVRKHAHKLIADRLAPAHPRKDGKQTPYRGHPVFPAQHATATCCRSCLLKWHGILKGQELSELEQDYVVEVICRWIERQRDLTPGPPTPRARRGSGTGSRSRDKSASAQIDTPLF